ncbi:MAG: hypothetical protein ACJ72D_02050 [Marmoricola sp.]
MGAALVLLAGVLAVVIGPGDKLPRAEAASVVSNETCRRYDPNLVRGACLRYQARSGTSYTWIGSYRASNGHVFFCIDYLYDSRISGTPEILPTTSLVNQLGKHVGNAEVAALNYIVSTWASHGSTGSDTRDAAIALIIRELMSDGVRPDGTVVYPRGLQVGQQVRAPAGGLGGPIMSQAQSMWAQASRYYGGYRLIMSTTATASFIRLGTSRTFQVWVRSGAGVAVPGVKIQFRCTGPVTCPAAVESRDKPVTVRLTPTSTGSSTLHASANGPAADGHVYRVHSWSFHGGSTAANRGVQRGWIAERSTTNAEASAKVQIVKGTPVVLTRASHQQATPETPLHDVVTVSDLPAGYAAKATATLYGPFDGSPDGASCTADHVAGSVSFDVVRNGDVTTPTVAVTGPGYYVWTESLPGDERTNAVTTPCGVAEETTLITAPKPVVRTPAVRTQASVQRAEVGARIHDTVVVTGLGTGDRVTVGWTLRGPLAPRNGSCAGLAWSRVGVLGRGSFVATRNGTFRTSVVRLTQPGCVTYAENLTATATTTAVQAPPGLPTETALVTRPVVPIVPEIPSGPFSAGRTFRLPW